MHKSLDSFFDRLALASFTHTAPGEGLLDPVFSSLAVCVHTEQQSLARGTVLSAVAHLFGATCTRIEDALTMAAGNWDVNVRQCWQQLLELTRRCAAHKIGLEQQ